MLHTKLSHSWHCVQIGGDPEKSLSDVRGADARSAEILRPAGVTLGFQVSEYVVEPSKPKAARNLLSSND
jgi:hypothetical protein